MVVDLAECTREVVMLPRRLLDNHEYQGVGDHSTEKRKKHEPLTLHAQPFSFPQVILLLAYCVLSLSLSVEVEGHEARGYEENQGGNGEDFEHFELLVRDQWRVTLTLTLTLGSGCYYHSRPIRFYDHTWLLKCTTTVPVLQFLSFPSKTNMQLVLCSKIVLEVFFVHNT